jgi:hypothetical protein
MLRAMAVAGAGTATVALGAEPVFAGFSPPVSGRQYLKFGGLNFTPISTVSKEGDRTDWTYYDNGSIYVTGRPAPFRTRLQIPQGALIEEVQFNYFLGSLPQMDFSLIAFDGANGYQPNIPSRRSILPTPMRFRP